jgi:carboxymethylenebutenolidase
MSDTLSEAEMVRLWETHLRLEFETRDAAATVATMTPDNYVNHVPVMTGGRGRDGMIEFYGRFFIPRMPDDTAIRLLARTVGMDRLVDEFVFSFTHDVEMPWMLPGVPPTYRRVEVPTVVVVEFRGERIACERIYWDQASVLVQLGLLDPAGLPVAGVAEARKFEDPSLPSNELIHGKTAR